MPICYNITTNSASTTQVRFLAPKDYDSTDIYMVNGSLRQLKQVDGNPIVHGWVTGAPLVFNLGEDGMSMYMDINDVGGGLTLDPILANNSWEAIAYAAEKGLAADTWNIGDTIDVQVGDETLTFAIMDFNHDDLADGSGKAGITFGMKELMANTYNMNDSNDNVGSFVASTMFSYLRDTVLPSLPQDLQNAIKEVNKLTSAGSQSTSIQTDSMKLWLFSEVEVFGTTTYSVAGEGSQYPYFATTGNRIKRMSNGAGAADYWWERSPTRTHSDYFCYVRSDGTPSNGYLASFSFGVCFGFCV